MHAPKLLAIDLETLSLPREKFIAYLETLPNGGYIIEICKNCGVYRTSPEGNVEDFQLTEDCRLCHKFNKTTWGES